jgi:hypothetical protein
MNACLIVKKFKHTLLETLQESCKVCNFFLKSVNCATNCKANAAFSVNHQLTGVLKTIMS